MPPTFLGGSHSEHVCHGHPLPETAIPPPAAGEAFQNLKLLCWLLILTNFCKSLPEAVLISPLMHVYHAACGT